MENNSIEFYAQLDVSNRTKQNYRNAINSTFVKKTLEMFSDTNDLFAIKDLELLWKVYSYINIHPINIANHRGYSAAIMKYIRYLNDGKKYGKRIDYNKNKKKI